MKEKPILFKPSMVKAIRNCKPGVWPAEPIDSALPWKWQTRRVMKPQPQYFNSLQRGIMHEGQSAWLWSKCKNDEWYAWQCNDFKFDPRISCECPYGQSADGLWVRESWNWSYSSVKDVDGKGPNNRQDLIVYAANGEQNILGWKWRPSIFMPRWASREDLIIKAVRVERVQEITLEDAKAEGVKHYIHGEYNKVYSSSVPSIVNFERLWNSINNKAKKAKRNPYTLEPEDCYVCYPWYGVPAKQQHRDLPLYVIPNPWVWTVEFMRLAK